MVVVDTHPLDLRSGDRSTGLDRRSDLEDAVVVLGTDHYGLRF